MAQHLAVEEPTGTEPDVGAAISALLAAYSGVLANAERERWRRRPLRIFGLHVPLPPPLATRTRPLRGTEPPRLPRQSWPVRRLVNARIVRASEELHRVLSLRHATGTAMPSETGARDKVSAFRDGLRPVHGKTAIAFVVVAVLFLGRIAVEQASNVVGWLPTSQILRDLTDKDVTINFTDVRDLADKLADKISLDPNAAGDVLDAMVHARVTDVGLLLVAFSLAAYVVLRPLSPAFRLSRMLLNLDGSYEEWRDRTTARWHVARSTGVYARERDVFARLGAAPPREVPSDLIVHALLLAAPVVLGVQLLTTIGDESFLPEYPQAVVTGAVSLFALAAVRAAWLVRTWRRRLGPPRLWAPLEVRLVDGSHVKLRDPLVSAAFNQWLPYYWWIWWWLLHGDLHALARSRGIRAARVRPWLHGLALTPALWWLILPPLVSFWLTVDRLRTILGRGSLSRRTLATVIAAGLLLAVATRWDFFNLVSVLARVAPWPLPELALLATIAAVVVRDGVVSGESQRATVTRTVVVTAVSVPVYMFTRSGRFGSTEVFLLLGALFSPILTYVVQNKLNRGIRGDDRAVIQLEGPA